MTPGTHHLNAIANVQSKFTFTWKTGTAPALTPVNLTGYSARFVVAKQPSPTAVIDLSTVSGIVLTPTQGKIEVTVSRAQMAIEQGEYHYYLVLTSGAGDDYPLLTGRFIVAKTGVPA